MNRFLKLLGSLTIAVPLLVTIAVVLAWGTIYETRYGTAAVQRFVYRAWWFQGLLAFLAINLAMAAFERYPWKRRHLPFVLAHLGIILILIGGILGGRYGIEGQLIITEGQAERVLQMPGNVLAVSQSNPGIQQILPTRFETQAWIREPNAVFPIAMDGREVRLTVDRYYPDAVARETITGDGDEDNPAVQVVVRHRQQEQTVWLLAGSPERFGVGWREGHVLFLEPKTTSQFRRLTSTSAESLPSRGQVTIHLNASGRDIDVPVPEKQGHMVELKGTPYRITFKDYFPDFAITARGPVSQSEEPRNPAVSFTLSGPEGTDAHLLFALHPDVSVMHGWTHNIPAHVNYTHPAGESLPPRAVVLLRSPSGGLAAVMTGPAGERDIIERVEVGKAYAHSWIGGDFEVAAYEPRAQVIEDIVNRGETVKTDAVHVIAEEGGERAEGWVRIRGSTQLPLGNEPLVVEYRPDQRELPVTIKLLDFRKTDYPGTQMAAEFESDVQLSDPERGVILMRKISMNKPLRYRGYSFYQSSYIPGPVETTVLSVRNDPGTPLVYAGFVIVIGGIVAMFTGRRTAGASTQRRTRA